MERVRYLGRDTPENAHVIQEEVDIEDTTIEVVEDRSEFWHYTSVPESVPQNQVLISFEVPEGEYKTLMHRICEVLNSTST